MNGSDDEKCMRPLFVPRRHETLMISPERPGGIGRRRGALARRPLVFLERTATNATWVRSSGAAGELTLKKGGAKASAGSGERRPGSPPTSLD